MQTQNYSGEYLLATGINATKQKYKKDKVFYTHEK